MLSNTTQTAIVFTDNRYIRDIARLTPTNESDVSKTKYCAESRSSLRDQIQRLSKDHVANARDLEKPVILSNFVSMGGSGMDACRRSFASSIYCSATYLQGDIFISPPSILYLIMAAALVVGISKLYSKPMVPCVLTTMTVYCASRTLYSSLRAYLSKLLAEERAARPSTLVTTPPSTLETLYQRYKSIKSILNKSVDKWVAPVVIPPLSLKNFLIVSVATLVTVSLLVKKPTIVMAIYITAVVLSDYVSPYYKDEVWKKFAPFITKVE